MSIFGGHQPLFGKESELGQVDLNLTPLMDVMSNILFFLLASVGASVVALLPASLPTRSDSATAAEPPVDQVMVTLQITDRAIKATAANERLSREEVQTLRFELGKGPAPWSFPYDELTSRLVKIKDKYKGSDTVIILPDNTVPYDVIIKTMDAARGTGLGVRQNLFTKVVISDLIR
jgi:biopolymer transport protein ExbD